MAGERPRPARRWKWRAALCAAAVLAAFGGASAALLHSAGEDPERELAALEKIDSRGSPREREASIWARKGDLLLELGRLTEAEAAYEQAHVRGAYLQTHAGLAQVYQKQGRPPGTVWDKLKASKRPTDIESDFVELMLAMGDISRDEEKFGPAERYYRGILAVSVRHDAVFQARARLADLEARRGRSREALAAYAELLDKGHQDPRWTASVHAAMGRLYENAGRSGEAAEAFRKAGPRTGRPGLRERIRELAQRSAPRRGAYAYALALLSFAFFIADLSARNLPAVKRFGARDWLAISGIWLLYVLARHQWLPAQNPDAHEPALLAALNAPGLPAQVPFGYGKLYYVMLAGFKRLKELSTGIDFVRFPNAWPSLYDLLAAPAAVFLAAACRRWGLGAGASLLSVALVLFHPVGLFWSCVVTDHWAAALVAALAAFHVNDALLSKPLRPGRAALALAAALISAFYFKYTALLLAPCIAAGVLALKAPARSKLLLLGSLGAAAAACVYTEAASVLHFYGGISATWKDYDPWRIPTYWDFSAMLEYVRPWGNVLFAVTLAAGCLRAARKHRDRFLWPLWAPFALVSLAFPWGYTHPGDRLFLPLIFFATPFLAMGLEALKAAWARAASRRKPLFRYAGAGAALFLVALLGRSGWAFLALARSMSGHPESDVAFAQAASAAPWMDAGSFTRFLTEAAGPRGVVNLIADHYQPARRELLRRNETPVWINAYILPVDAAYAGFRTAPTFLVLEADAFRRNSRLRRDYKIILESRFRLELAAYQMETKSLVYRLVPR